MAAPEPNARAPITTVATALLTLAISGCVPAMPTADAGDAMLLMTPGCTRDFTNDTLCPPAQPKFYFCTPPRAPGSSSQCAVHRDRAGVFSEWCCTPNTP